MKELSVKKENSRVRDFDKYVHQRLSENISSLKLTVEKINRKYGDEYLEYYARESLRIVERLYVELFLLSFLYQGPWLSPEPYWNMEVRLIQLREGILEGMCSLVTGEK